MPSASSKQASQTSSAEGTDAMRQSLAVIEKKIRNLEKRKGKLDAYKVMVDAGQELNKDQRDAIAKFDEVVSNLEFAKDLVKQFQGIIQDGVKQQKKVAKREQLHRLEHEQKRIKSVLELQDVLEQLGSESIRKDFAEGGHGAVELSEEELKQLDDFYKLVSPTRETEEGEETQSFSEKQTAASEHLLSFLDAKPKEVCGTTYKGLKDVVDRVIECGYLENIPSHSENGETEAEPEEVEAEETTKETEEYVVVESDEVPPADAPEVASSLPPELPPTSTEEPAMMSSSNGPLMSESMLPTHKPQRDVSEVLAAVQGDFNFMQESMIDFQSPHMDPAVVAVSQPLLPPPQQSTASAIPQSSQDPTAHTTLEQLSHQPSIEQLTQQTTSALESVMRSSNLPPQSLAQEQYAGAPSDQGASSQQHSNLGAATGLGTPPMLGQQSLVSSQTVPLSSTDSQMSAASHMSQTLPPQSMTGPSQLSESSQLSETLSTQLSSVQNPSSMAPTTSDPSQTMTLSHEQSQTPQEQPQPAPPKSSQINVNAPPFQSMNYMRQQASYLQPTSQAQIVTSQQLEFADQGLQQAETQYYSQPPTLQETQSAHDAQMTVQSTEAHAPGSYPHQHPGMGQPGSYQRPTSAGRGNGRGRGGTRGAGGSSYRGGGGRPPFNTRNGRFPSPSYRGGYSQSYQPRDYQSSYMPQDSRQYGPGFSQSSYKRGGSGGVPPRGGAPRGGRGTAPRGGNNRGRGGFPKPNQTPVTA